MAVAETSESAKEEAAHEKIDASATLRKSTEVYEGMIKGTHGHVPSSVLAKARCIVVLPDLSDGSCRCGRHSWSWRCKL